MQTLDNFMQLCELQTNEDFQCFCDFSVLDQLSDIAIHVESCY